MHLAIRGASLCLNALLQCLHKHPRHINPRLLHDLAEAGRAGDADLGQPIADDIEADQQQAGGLEFRVEGLRDLPVALGLQPGTRLVVYLKRLR